MTTENFTCKIPEQMYCGFQQRASVDDVPLGFMTPVGTDKAFEKRKATIDDWASSSNRVYNYVTKSYDVTGGLDPVTFDNEPMLGFRFGRSITRNSGWGSKNIVIRMEDPRGFELEITVANLIEIMKNNTVENGEIMAECVWGRDGSTNILLATNSAPYLSAVENTARMKKHVPIKDIAPGMKVRLKNGKVVTYYGKFFMWTTTRDTTDGYATNRKVIQEDKKKHVILEEVSSKYNNTVYQELKAAPSFSFAEIVDDTSITEIEAEKAVNELLTTLDHYKRNDYLAASLTKVEVTVERRPFDYTLYDEKDNTQYYEYAYVDVAGKIYEANRNHLRSGGGWSPKTPNEREFSEVTIDMTTGCVTHIKNPYYLQRRGFGYGSSRSYGYELMFTVPDYTLLSYTKMICKFTSNGTDFEFIAY